LLSLVPALAAAFFLAKEKFLEAAFFFAFAAFIDLIDGSVARVLGRPTKFGAYLDTITDRYVEFMIILGMFFASLPSFYFSASAWLFLYLFGSMMTTYAKAAASEKKLVEAELRGGLLERAERLILLFAGIIAYIILQKWYKRRYEDYLFKNKNDLYNLLHYIEAQRKKGVHESEIHYKLKNSGWNSEQIKYATRKHSGLRTGMLEIPIEKVFKKIDEKDSRRH